MSRCLILGSSADLYGASKVLAAAARVFGDMGIDPVVALPADGPLAQALDEAGAEVLVFPDFALRRRYFRAGTAGQLLRSNRNLLRWAVERHRRTPFQFVYSSTQAVVAGPLIARRLRCPHVWHVHEILESPRWLARFLARAASMGASVVVCPSHAVADHLRAYAPGVEPRLVVVPNNIETSRLALLDAPTRAATLRAGCVARLHPWKGQDVAIAATAGARERGVPVTLALFGDPAPGNEWVKDQLRASVEASNVSDAVTFAGFEPDEGAIYGGLDLVLVPSTAPEPFSLVCLEAQAAARPVIASNEGGPRELVVNEETGLLVAPRSVEALVAAFQRMWADPEQVTAMGLRGRERVLAHYSGPAFAAGLRSVVERLPGRT